MLSREEDLDRKSAELEVEESPRRGGGRIVGDQKKRIGQQRWCWKCSLAKEIAGNSGREKTQRLNRRGISGGDHLKGEGRGRDSWGGGGGAERLTWGKR